MPILLSFCLLENESVNHLLSHFHSLVMESSQIITPYTQQSIQPLQSSTMQRPSASQTQYVDVPQSSVIIQPPQQQLVPVQPIAYSSPPALLQPIVIPQPSKSPSISSSVDQTKQKPVVNEHQLTVNTSKLGDL